MKITKALSDAIRLTLANEVCVSQCLDTSPDRKRVLDQILWTLNSYRPEGDSEED